MLHSLTTKNIGPMAEMQLDFGAELNIFTGDNGLGKSFVLDVIWFALTETWPKDMNPKLTQGYMVRPQEGKEGIFSVVLEANDTVQSSIKTSITEKTFEFNYESQRWFYKENKLDRNPIDKNIVIYAMADGSFAVWDALRKGSCAGRGDIMDMTVADIVRFYPYIFSPQEIWDGLQDDEGKWFCNGLIRDWASWQREKKESFALLQQTLASLSPVGEPIGIGELTRISIDDVRDMPTIITPYGQVPVVHASSGIKRALTLAYLLTWAKVENALTAKLRNTQPTKSLVFLVDELEAHLHPKWQRSMAQSFIIPNVTQGKKSQDAALNSNVQFFITTHSPLVMASLESYFLSSEGQNGGVWFDIDLDTKTGRVSLQERDFVAWGTASHWLTSPAFDLKSATSLERETVEEKVRAFLQRNDQTEEELCDLEKEVAPALSDIDLLWLDIRDMCREKGWGL